MNQNAQIVYGTNDKFINVVSSKMDTYSIWYRMTNDRFTYQLRIIRNLIILKVAHKTFLVISSVFPKLEKVNLSQPQKTSSHGLKEKGEIHTG